MLTYGMITVNNCIWNRKKRIRKYNNDQLHPYSIDDIKNKDSDIPK